MNEQAEKTAVPMHSDLDLLCQLYMNMSVENFKQHGFDFRNIVHMRYTPADIRTIRSAKKTRIPSLLKPVHELRAKFDLSVEQGNPDMNYISPHGGGTHMLVVDPYNNEISVDAHCSILDTFNRRKGIRTALGHLFMELCELYDFSKAEVKEAVATFYKEHPAEVHESVLPAVV